MGQTTGKRTDGKQSVPHRKKYRSTAQGQQMKRVFNREEIF